MIIFGPRQNIVCIEKIQSLDHLRQRIIVAALTSVTPETLQRTWAEIGYLLDV